ncbi:MAG: hypothetical protein ACTHU0_22445 [Kofleriaceae bacterium]
MARGGGGGLVFDAHACAVRTNGGAVCWGANDDGACNLPQR